MALPKLSAQQPIAGNLRPTSPFLQFMEALRIAQEATDARQDAVDAELVAINTAQDALIADLTATQADLQTQVDRLTAVLNGTTAFTGLKVGSTNVKPFLDKTNGSALTNSTGLSSSVVTSPALIAGAANQVLSVHTAASLSVPASTDTVVQTLVVTTVAGETVDLNGQFTHSQISDATTTPTLYGTWHRNGTPLVPSSFKSAIDVTRAADPSRYVMALGILSVPAVDVPGAGTHTYTLVALCNDTALVESRYGRVLTATRP